MKDSGKNIAVIGAGVMGLSVGYAMRGYDVSLYDTKGFPAPNASAMAGGMLAPYSEIEHLPEEFVAAALHGIDLWERILPTLKDKVEFHRNGSLLVAHKDDEYILERFAAKLPGTHNLNSEKISALEPDLGNRFETGIYLPQEAHINPQQILNALAGVVSTHITEAVNPKNLGDQYDWIIDCRGFGAESDDKELRGVKGEIAYIRNPEFNLTRPVRLMHPRYPLYIVPRPDNVFMIGATIIESADSNVNVKSALELLSAAYSLHPSFAEATILEISAGIRPAYPDNLPRIKIDGNIIRCNGLFRHGYLLSPVIAECVADYVAGRDNSFISLFMRGQNNDHNNQRPEKRHQRIA